MAQPRLFELPGKLRPYFALALFAGILLTAVSTFWLGTHHPDYSPPRGKRAEAEINRVFALSPNADDTSLMGDYAIERFYAIKPGDGRIYVADLCKGRVKEILESSRPDGQMSYSLVVDRSDVRAAQIQDVLNREAATEVSGTYLGVIVQDGSVDTLPLNYDGQLPHDRMSFQTLRGDDLATYLKSIPSGVTVKSFSTINVKGTNWVLGSTDINPYFSSRFGLKGAILISHLVFVDRHGAGSNQ